MEIGHRVRSCRPCRERKVKCDRGNPCKSCIRHNCEDQCQPGRKPTTDGHKIQIERVHKPMTQNRALSTTTSTTSPASFTPQAQTPLVMGFSDRGVCPNTSFTLKNVTSTDAWLDLSSQSVESLHSYQKFESLLNPGSEIISAPTSSSFGVNLSTRERQQWQVYLASCLPPRTQCDLLVSFYFEHVNWIYQAVHSTSFRDTYNSLWTAPVASIDLIWLSLLYVILSASAQVMDPTLSNSMGLGERNVRDSVHVWFRLSRQALHAGEFEAKPCLTQIQGFLVSQLYWYGNKSVEILNSALGQTIRCAQAIGLDKDRSPATNLASEMRHRIWWDLCSSDTFQSLCLDRPPLLQSHSSQVPFPENCDDSDLSYSDITPRPVEYPTVMAVHVVRAKLFKLLNKLYANDGRATGSYETVSQVDAQMMSIIDRLPWFLCPSEVSAFASTTLPAGFEVICWQHHILHNSICIQRIRMYRPFLRSHFDQCWTKCIEAVERAFAVYHDIRAADGVRFQSSPKMLAQCYQIWASAISIAVFLLVERPILADKIQHDIDIVMRDLKLLSDGWASIPLAVDGRKALKKIVDAYHMYCREVSSFRASSQTCPGPLAQLRSLVPEIYTVMGGRDKTKTYLDRCAITHLVNKDVAIGSKTMGNVDADPCQSLISTSSSTLVDTQPEPFSADVFGTDPTTGLNLGLHFDMLVWGSDELAFLDDCT